MGDCPGARPKPDFGDVGRGGPMRERERNGKGHYFREFCFCHVCNRQRVKRHTLTAERDMLNNCHADRRYRRVSTNFINHISQTSGFMSNVCRGIVSVIKPGLTVSNPSLTSPYHYTGTPIFWSNLLLLQIFDQKF